MLPDSPPWIAPVAYWSLIQSITGLTVAFTSQQSLLRPITTAIISFLAHLFRLHINSHFQETRLWAPVFAMCMVNALNAFDLLLFTRASYTAQLAYATTKSEKKDNPTQHASLSNKLLFSLLLPYNYRRINTPWQISRLPRFSSTDPSYVPTRPAFLLRSALKLAIAGAVVRLLTIDPEDPHLLEALAHLEQSKSVLLPFRNYSAYTILLQARFTLSFGIITRAFIVGSYTANSILAVALGSDPASWPPVAGSLTEAWSLKTLWGQTWHQTLRLPLSFIAREITRTVALPPTSRAAHCIRVVTVFLASGAIHSFMDIGFGVPLSESGAWVFFPLQIVGLAFEGLVQVLADKLRVSSALGKYVKRGVGFIWVAGFLLWTAPVWVNPILEAVVVDGTRVMSPWLGMRPRVWGGL